MRNTTRCLLILVAVATLGPATAMAQGYARPAEDLAMQPKKSGFSAFTDSINSSIKRGFDKVSQSLHPTKDATLSADPTRLSNTATPGPELYLAVAKAQEERQRFHEAEAQYAKAMKMAPRHLPTMLAYAEYLDRRGRVSEAVGEYEKAVRAYPREAAAWNHLGLCHAEHHNLDKAASALEQAVKLDPTQPLYRNNFATVLVGMGRNRDAFAQLRATHDEATAYYNLGYLLQKRGQNRAAAQHFAAALRVNPRLSDARMWLNHLRSTSSSPQSATVAARTSARHNTSPLTPAPGPGSARPPIGTAPTRPLVARRDTSPALGQQSSAWRHDEATAEPPIWNPNPFRTAPIPPAPNQAGNSSVTDHVAAPETASSPDPASASTGSTMAAPLPPRLEVPSTRSYGTRNANIVYPLPPVATSSGRRR